MELLATVTIDKYVRLVTLSESRRTTYYERGKKKLPTKYANKVGVDYQWLNINGKEYLCDAWGTRVISNPNAAGTPKGVVISGNDLHSLRMLDSTRSKIIKAIKADMIPQIEKLEPILKFPIRIMCELHDTVVDWMYIDSKTGQPKEILWDIDNRALFYCKVFPDVLAGSPMVQEVPEENKFGVLENIKRKVFTSKRIIPDDNRFYITQPPVPVFVPIEDTKDRKLVFKIYHDDREVVQNNTFYRAKHGERTETL